MRAKYLGGGESRQPEEISEVLGALIEKAASQIDVRQGELVERWDEVAPPDWRSVATPVGVRENVLLVEVPNGTAASLLKYQTANLIAAISQEFGEDLVTGIKLRVRR